MAASLQSDGATSTSTAQATEPDSTPATASTSTSKMEESPTTHVEPVSSSDSERPASSTSRRQKRSSRSKSSTASTSNSNSSTRTSIGSRQGQRSGNSTSTRRSKSAEAPCSTNGSTPAPKSQKESLSKDRRPNPPIPPQLGNINPLGTDATTTPSTTAAAAAAAEGERENSNNPLDDSLRWSSLNNSASTHTAPSNCSESNSATMSFQSAQQSAQSFLALPSTPTSTKPEPEEGEAQSHSQSPKPAIHKKQELVQHATTTISAPVTATAADSVTLTQMQQELQTQQQQFLDFQTQIMEQQQQQQTQIQQQATLLEEQQKLIQAQQKQLLELKNEVLKLEQQTQAQEPLPSPKPTTTTSSTSSTRSPLRTRRQSKKAPTEQAEPTTEKETTPQQHDQADDSLRLDFPTNSPSPSPTSNSNTNTNANTKANPEETNTNNILSNEDSNASIETEYEDDSDYHLDEKEAEDKALQPQNSTSPSSSKPKDGLVDVWVCPNCNFEHEFSKLQFCGVCGAAKPEKDTNILKESSSPPTLQEPLIQLQLHEELQGHGPDEGAIDLPPKSPGRRRPPHKSKSSTDMRGSSTPKRPRQRLPPRSKTQPLSSTYHGKSNSKDSMLVRCIDGEEQGDVFDIDVLNQQLSTFERSDHMPGSAPTASAPKTPKVNKRGAFRRTKSVLDEPDSSPVQEVALTPPQVFAKPALRQSIPRRAKSNSTEYMQNALQQSGGMVENVHSSSNKDKKGMFGAAVSALHKSPKKAKTALKLAGKSLMLGGGGGTNKDKAFLLDSDNESGGEGNTSPSMEGDPSNRDAPLTPSQTRAKAALMAGTPPGSQKSGWKKWFDSGSKKTAEGEPVITAKLDIDESVNDVDADDEDLFETDHSDEEQEQERSSPNAKGRERHHRRNRPNNRRRSMEGKDGHVHGSNRNLNRGSGHGSSELLATPKRGEKARLRRSKSLESNSGGAWTSDSNSHANRRRRSSVGRRSKEPQRDVPGSSGEEFKRQQRLQGLRNKNSNSTEQDTNAQRKAATTSIKEETSESTDGCTIYLDEMSLGAVSEITHNLF